jgi:chromate transporter
MSIIQFFFTFVVLGFFSFGGGYSFLPIMEIELVDKLKWITHQQFILSITVGQVTPGPVMVAGSFAGFLAGYNFFHTIPAGIFFAAIAFLGANLATLTCMGVVMRIYKRVSRHPMMESLPQYIMPVVIGLILNLALKVGINGMTGWPQIVIGITAFALAITKKVDFVYIIIGGGLVGYFFL